MNKLTDIALPDICTADDIARMLGLSRRTVLAYFRAGLIPGRRVGRRWYAARIALLAHVSGTPPLPASATQLPCRPLA